MSGSADIPGTRGTGQQVMLTMSQWIHPETGQPTTTFYSLIQSLWSRTGGTAAPVGPSGTQGLAAVQAQLGVLESAVVDLEGQALGLFEIPDSLPDGSSSLDTGLLGGGDDVPGLQLQSTSVTFGAGTSGSGDTFFTASARLQVTGVVLRLNTANVAAASLTVFKAPSGTSVALGSPLTLGVGNLAGTPDTNQVLPLAAIANLLLDPGDSFGLLGTGTVLAATGSFTVSFLPL